MADPERNNIIPFVSAAEQEFRQGVRERAGKAVMEAWETHEARLRQNPAVDGLPGAYFGESGAAMTIPFAEDATEEQVADAIEGIDVPMIFPPKENPR